MLIFFQIRTFFIFKFLLFTQIDVSFHLKYEIMEFDQGRKKRINNYSSHQKS